MHADYDQRKFSGRNLVSGMIHIIIYDLWIESLLYSGMILCQPIIHYGVLHLNQPDLARNRNRPLEDGGSR